LRTMRHFRALPSKSCSTKDSKTRHGNEIGRSIAVTSGS
jgi:hypothetical protein